MGMGSFAFPMPYLGGRKSGKAPIEILHHANPLHPQDGNLQPGAVVALNRQPPARPARHVRELASMKHKSVYAIATSEGQTFQIVDSLTSAGFSTDDISILFPDKDSSHPFVHEKHSKAQEGTVAGAGTGGVVGGALGLMAGIGALAIPGVGPLHAAGPLLAALSGAAAGAAVGGIAGALIGMGIPEIEAKRYEHGISQGNFLISVHVTNEAEVKRAKDILAHEQASDIAVTSMAGA